MGGTEVAIIIMGLGGVVSTLATVIWRSWTSQMKVLKAENRALKKIIASNEEAMQAYLRAASQEGERWEG